MQPQKATIHSGRFSEKKTTLSPLPMPARAQARGESARRARDVRVAERRVLKPSSCTRNVAVCVGEVVEKVDERVAAHG